MGGGKWISEYFTKKFQLCFYWIMQSERSYEFLFYALFFFSHYFVQYGLIQVCIFYLFFWKTRFCLSALFVFSACPEFDVISITFYKICIIIIYIVEIRYSVFLFLLITSHLNNYENRQVNVIKTWLDLFASREVLNFKNSIDKEKCGTFTKRESVKETYQQIIYFWENLRSRSFILTEPLVLATL